MNNTSFRISLNQHFYPDAQVRRLLGNVTIGHMGPIASIKKQAGVLKKNAPDEVLTNFICSLDEMFDISRDKETGCFVEGGFMSMSQDLLNMLEHIRIDVNEWQQKMYDACEYAEEYPEDVVDGKVLQVLVAFAMKVIDRLYNICFGFGQ